MSKLTFEDKIKKCMNTFKLSRKEAIDKVHFLDWTVKENEFLESIYPKFKKDFDTDIPFVGMCEMLWNDKTTGIQKEYLEQLN